MDSTILTLKPNTKVVTKQLQTNISREDRCKDFSKSNYNKSKNDNIIKSG